MKPLTDLTTELQAAERAARAEMAALRICEAAFVAAILLALSVSWGVL